MVGGNFLETLANRGAHARGAAAAAPARAPGHRALVVDAGGPGGHGARAARNHALRVARRRHRDLHGAPDHLLAGDRGTPHRQRAPRVGGVRRGDRARAAEARPQLRYADAAPSAPRSRAPFRSTPGIETLRPRATRCSGAGPACSPTGAFATADGRAHLRRRGLRGRPTRARDVLRLHPPRQAVQLDGAARP